MEEETIKSHWHRSKGIGKENVGDTLTPIIVEYFTGKKVEWVDRHVTGKLVAIGSIMKVIRDKDVVWGAGVMRKKDRFNCAKRCHFLAIRGRLSEKILGIKCGVYGDPALLLPLMYTPTYEKKHKIGIIPHYIEQDEPVFKKLIEEGGYFINILDPWKKFVDEITSCDEIITSSLHGVVIAEAYGIPVRWLKATDKVIGDGFKFFDYFSGTGRYEYMIDGPYIKPDPIKNLSEIQEKLINVLQKYYE